MVAPGNVVTYLHADETGSVILAVDATGMTVTKNTFTPWESSSGSLSSIPVGYTGQFFDPISELYYYKNRHYSPKLGRFLQPDPASYEGGSNLYEYVGNSPTNYSDPLGLIRTRHPGCPCSTLALQ